MAAWSYGDRLPLRPAAALGILWGFLGICQAISATSLPNRRQLNFLQHGDRRDQKIFKSSMAAGSLQAKTTE